MIEVNLWTASYRIPEIQSRIEKLELNPVSELRILLCSWRRLSVGFGGLPPTLLAFEFLGQLTLEAFPFSRFQKIGVFLHLFDNALLLNLPLETAQGALNGFTFENSDFGQSMPP